MVERPLTQQPELTATAHRGETIVRNRQTHQAHVVIGAGGYNVFDNRRLPLFLLNNLLGGPGMNARFNMVLRERNALVYTVESTQSTWDDCGAWYTYFGCDHKDVDRCLRLIRREMDAMMATPLSPTRLAAAKRQLKGQIEVGNDVRHSRAIEFATDYLHLGIEKQTSRLFERIDGITSEQLRNVACEVFAPDNLTTLIFH